MRHFALRIPALALGLALAAFSQAPAPHALTIPDVMHFQGIAGDALSRDGGWLAYRATSMEGDGAVYFRQTRGDKQYHFDVGEEPAPTAYGQRPSPRAQEMSSDGLWAAFIADPTHAETAKLKKQHKPLETHAGLVDLATGKVIEFPRVRRFEFSGDNPDWIAFEKYGPEPAAGAGSGRGNAHRSPEDTPEADPKGSDVILRQLSTGAEYNLGHVDEFAFDRKGHYLAYTIAAEDRSGNGALLRDLATGATRALDSDNHAVYRQLTWNHDGNALAVLKGTENKKSLDYNYELLGFTGIGGSAAPARVAFNPADDHSFPAGMSLSPSRAPEWSETGDALFFGIHTLRPAPDKNAEEDADAADDVDLVIWNYQDPRLQTEQIKEEGRDRSFSYLAEYRPAEHKFIRLADDTVRTVTVAPHDRYAIGAGVAPYELQGHLDGQTYEDLYVTDLATGGRKLAIPKARWGDEAAPDGTHFSFYKDGNYWVYDMATGAQANVTAKVPTSFIDTEDDHNLDRPPVRQVGWSRDSRDLILSDNWDLWKVPIAGGAAVNLTQDGKRDGIRYRNPENFEQRFDATRHGFDLTQPLYVAAYGEWTKKAGIAVIQPGAPGAHRLMFDEAAYNRLTKAENAPVYVYTRETYNQPPDFYAAGPALAQPAKLSDFAAQMQQFLWSSGTILVNYTGYKGDKLQGALHLPPNYVKGEKVPMMVEFYEKMSQNAYQFIRPTANGFSIPLYNSNGYAVFDPDISYKVDDPGVSSAGCLINAVEAAIATGVPDPQHIGIHGHSWGGYQTAFVITQTHLFAAAMAGAPLTDMISMYGVIYKNSGVTNGQIFEASQGRFTGPPWDLWQVYTRNSPVANVKNVTTPLLMLSDYDDGAVDFTQGMEYFNALRRLHKPVVLLDYPSQNHSLSKRADQKDYTIRMMQFFDHYLKGAPMPAWYAHGVSALDMEAYMREFQEKTSPAKATAAAASTGSSGGGH